MLLISECNLKRVVQAGQVFQTNNIDGHIFIERGLARKLTKQEINTILDSYVEEWEKLQGGE